jgi:hypothetical protein
VEGVALAPRAGRRAARTAQTRARVRWWAFPPPPAHSPSWHPPRGDCAHASLLPPHRTHSSLRPHAADATQERGGELLDAGTARTRRRAVADDAWGDSQAVVADPSPGHARPRGAGPMTNGDDGSYGEVTMCVIKKEARTTALQRESLPTLSSECWAHLSAVRG